MNVSKKSWWEYAMNRKGDVKILLSENNSEQSKFPLMSHPYSWSVILIVDYLPKEKSIMNKIICEGGGGKMIKMIMTSFCLVFHLIFSRIKV